MSIVRPCQHPGCPEYAAPKESMCPAHVRAVDRTTKRKGAALYRSARWQAARRAQLRSFPWCQHPGCFRLATQVDHIIGLRDGGAEVAPSNLQSLCASHHSAKTAREVWHSGA